MKNLLYLAGAASLVTFTGAISLKATDRPSVIHAGIQRRPFVGGSAARDRKRRGLKLRTRASTVELDLTNDITLYLANVTIGTPAKAFSLHIDTGSSDTWVPTASSSACQQYSTYCDELGSYTSSSSSTYKFVNSDFSIKYADGSTAAGDYATDTLTISGATISAQEIGIASQADLPIGILGIGYPTNEAIVAQAGGSSYANVPQRLQQSGFINTAAYSLWLNDLDSNSGSILFGGVDSDKYTGSLESFPIISTSGVYAEFLIGMTGIGINGNTGSVASGQSISVLLDSGSSLSYLSSTITDKLFSTYSATYDSSVGAASVSCDLADQSGSVDFTFSTSKTISVPLSELVFIESYSSSGEPQCIFGVAPIDSQFSVLGDTFLRSAYVVYDLANNEISLAATNFNATSSSVLEITSSGVPNASSAADAATTASNAATITNGIGGIVVPVTGTGTAAVTVAGGGSSTVGATTTVAAGLHMATPPAMGAFAALAAAGMGAVLLL